MEEAYELAVYLPLSFKTESDQEGDAAEHAGPELALRQNASPRRGFGFVFSVLFCGR